MSEKKPFYLRCARGDPDAAKADKKCGHVWIGAYYPMEASLFASTVMMAVCPMCGGADDIYVAVDEEIKRAGLCDSNKVIPTTS